MLHLVVVSLIRKEKKRKRKINNDLAVLPSYDRNDIELSWKLHLLEHLFQIFTYKYGIVVTF